MGYTSFCVLLASFSIQNILALDHDEGFSTEKVDSAILYSYRVDATSPTYLSRVNIIFKIPSEEKRQVVRIYKQTSIKTVYEYSDTDNTAAKRMVKSSGMNISPGSFSMSNSMEFSKTANKNIKTVRMDALVKYKKYKMLSVGRLRIRPHKYLCPHIVEAIKELPIEEFEEAIGVFYATSLKLGGEVRKSFVKQATAQDNEAGFKKELSMEFGKSLMGGPMTRNNQNSNSKSDKTSQVSVKFVAQGGDTAVWLGQGEKLKTTANVEQVEQEWANSFDTSNYYPFGFRLKPIWKLVKRIDKAKGEALQKYLEKKWKSQENAFHPTQFLKAVPNCYKGTDPRQQDYRGLEAKTASGKLCQRWTSQHPHRHSTIPEKYPDSGLGKHNYCRNPNSGKQAWCYTMDAKTKWEYCSVPHCKECYFGHDTNMTDYRGTTEKSASGALCKKWPIPKQKVVKVYRKSRWGRVRVTNVLKNPDINGWATQGLGRHKYCRNKGGSQAKPYCYVSADKWEYCSITEC